MAPLMGLMFPLAEAASSAIVTVGVVAALRRMQPVSIRMTFRDKVSEHLWSELVDNTPSVLLVPDMDADSRRGLVKEITRHYLLKGPRVFLCIRAAALSVPIDEANVWAIKTEAGVLLYVISGCRRLSFLTVFIARALQARAIYARLPVGEAENSLLRKYTRWLLGLSGDDPYALHWQLQKENHGRVPIVVFLWRTHEPLSNTSMRG